MPCSWQSCATVFRVSTTCLLRKRTGPIPAWRLPKNSAAGHPSSRWARLQRRRVPELHLAAAAVAAGGGQGLAVRTESHAHDVADVPAQRGDLLARGRVPALRHVVAAPRGHAFAVGAEGHT